MLEISKIAGLLLLSALKFFLAPSTTVYAGYSFLETLIITFSGGAIGFVLFFRFGTLISNFLQKFRKKKQRKRFSRSKRMLVKIKVKYGLWGLALLTPCLLGVPLGAFLASAYYAHDRRTIPAFLASLFLWSGFLTLLSLSV